MSQQVGINHSNYVKADTFIGRYMSYMSEQETPTAYDFWCALWLMSLAVGRGCVVARPRAPVYMNIYAMLVAESGVTRKSSAVRMATRIAREFMLKYDETFDLIQSKTTPEQLEWRMHNASHVHGHSYLAISISELVTFLGREKYNISMPGLLTDLYDAPALRTSGGTLSRGSSVLREVYVSFLSASTPSWLARAINPDVVEGGFTSRCCFIHEERRKKRIPWPHDREDNEQQEQRLVDDLGAIRKRALEVRRIEMSDGAMRRFTNWYRTRDEHHDPFRASFESREDAHILRVAAMLSINNGQWQIQASEIIKAIDIISIVKANGAKIFAGGSTNTKRVLGIDKLREVLLAGGMDGVGQSDLTQRTRAYLSNREMQIALSIMHELGMVQKFELSSSSTRGRRKTVWRGTNTLLSPGAMTAILEKMES